VAFVLGVKSSAKVSRYEKFNRVPNLETALALQALFGTSVAELFAGVYQEVEKKTAKRAMTLQQKMQNEVSDRKSARKAELLRAIAVTPDINKENP
jgi:transcriptional regulator with XRE-family HTH domain